MGGKCLQVADTVTRVVECISNPNRIRKYYCLLKKSGYKKASIKIKIVGVPKSKFTVKS